MYSLPLQLVDDFLMDYTAGHAIFLLFLLAVLGGFAVNRSVKVLGIQLSLFGILFVVTPNSMVPTSLLYLGLALIVVGPVVVIAGDE